MSSNVGPLSLDDPESIHVNDFSAKCRKDLAEPVPGALSVVWLPVPKGGKSPWFSNARSLVHYARGVKNSQMVWMLQYILLGLETNLGTPNFTIDRSTNWRVYKHVLEMHVRDVQGFSSDVEKQTLKRVRFYSGYFDPALSKEISNHMKTVKLPLSNRGAAEEDGAAYVNDAAREAFSNALHRLAQRIVHISSNDTAEAIRGRATWPYHNMDNPPSIVAAAVADMSYDQQQEHFRQFCATPLQMKPRFRVDVFTFPHSVPGSDIESHDVYRVAIFDPLYDFTQINTVLDRVCDERERTEKAQQRNTTRAVVSKFEDPFLHLERDRSTHPAFNWSFPKYCECVQWFLNREIEEQDRQIAKSTRSIHISLQSIFHPTRFLTFDNALELLRSCGADVSAAAGKEDQFIARDEATGTITLLPGPVDREVGLGNPPAANGMHSYEIVPEQCFWRDTRRLGLSEICFPNCIVSNNYDRTLIEHRGDPEIPESMPQQQQRNEDAAQQPLASYFERNYRNPVIYRDSLPKPLVPYKTGDAFIWMYYEHKAAESIVKQWLPFSPMDNPEMYGIYCKIMRKKMESGKQKFCSLWLVKGNVLDLPIPAPIKHILIWYQSKNFITTSVTQHYNDLEVSIYGNYRIRLLSSFRQIARIIQAPIPLIAMALQIVYRHEPGQLKFHICLCGPADVGKTYSLMGTIKKYIMIEGTYEETHSFSKRANNSQTHRSDCVVLCDEPPRYLNDPKAAEKHYEELQENKLILQNGQTTRSVLEYDETSGKKIRITKNIVTNVDVTNAWCTNLARNPDHALGTRIFQLTVKRNDIPPESMNFDSGEALNTDFRIFLNIQQFHTCEIFKAIMVGALPDINMWLFNTVSNNMVSVLRRWDLVDSKRGSRPLEIMSALFRYMVVSRAIVAVRHTPGGPLYKVPYSPTQIGVYADYLTSTLEMVLECWHVMHEEYIHDDACNVIMTWMRMIRYNSLKTPLENWKKPGGSELPFARTEKDPNNTDDRGAVILGGGGGGGGGGQQMREMVNLNYLAYPGTMDAFAKAVAPNTKPLMSDTDVKTVLESLRERSFIPPDGRNYRVLNKDTLLQYEGEEDALKADAPNKPEDYFYVPVATYFHGHHKEYRVNTRFLEFLDLAAIEQAFYNTTMCSTFPRQKAIIGLPLDNCPDLFEVRNWSPEFIDAYVAELDEANMLDEGEANGDEVSHEARSIGVSVNQASAITAAEETILIGSSMDPRRKNHKDVYGQIVDNRKDFFYLVTDWDKEAAYRQYFSAGLPLDRVHQDAKTEAYIRKAYDAYLIAHPEERPEKHINYPEDILEMRKGRDVQHAKNNKVSDKRSRGIMQRLEERGITAKVNYHRHEQVPAPMRRNE